MSGGQAPLLAAEDLTTLRGFIEAVDADTTVRVLLGGRTLDAASAAGLRLSGPAAA